MHLNNMDSAALALKENFGFEGAEEILLPYLDSLYKETIDTSDQTIFTDLTQAMEKAFNDDMEALNVLPPDAVTRVTEYVPQIVSFVEQIIKKGFAYEANGSVYFDIAAFEKAGNTYARLRPESRNDKALQEEGEGSLSKGLEGKKFPGDFALCVPLPNSSCRLTNVTPIGGRSRNLASRIGQVRGARAVPAGTSSARSWLPTNSASRWISILAVLTLPSHITITS
jgi:hypothetical protein